MKKCNRGVERTQERCYQEALKCTTYKEFMEKHASCYEKARKTGWINDYTWLKKSRKLPGHWMIYENVYEEAKKYETKKEFKKSNIVAYRQACKNNWINDYTWFKKPILSEESVYCVYKYYDVKTNSVYVGLTNNMKRRHREHLKPTKGTNDAVYNFFNSINEIIPEPIILEENLTAGEAQDREEKYVMLYKKQGMNVLNKAKTGSIGGLYMWDYESCYQVAKTCTSRKEFRDRYLGAYSAAHRCGWFNDYYWLIPKCKKNYWNYDTCYQEARKYNSRRDFLNGCSGGCQVAIKNNWIKDYTWFLSQKELVKITRTKWNYDTCYQEARKYNSRTEFRKSGRPYQVASKEGWINDYTWLENCRNLPGYWTYEKCYNAARKYKIKKDFRLNEPQAYSAATNNHWIKDYTWLKNKSINQFC
jgi:hypothetical protein